MPRYIDADELNHIKFHPLPYIHITPADIEDAESYERGWNDAIDAIIENEPTADVVEVRHGKWIKMSNGYGIFWVCSNCGKSIPRITYFDRESDLFPKTKGINRTNYCPNCGARMEERREDVDTSD